MSGWALKFDDPIILPNGRKLVTLRDAGEDISALPAKTQKAPHWQAATHTLLLVADSNGHAMLARVAMMKALNHGKATAPAEPQRKRAKKYRVVR